MIKLPCLTQGDVYWCSYFWFQFSGRLNDYNSTLKSLRARRDMLYSRLSDVLVAKVWWCSCLIVALFNFFLLVWGLTVVNISFWNSYTKLSAKKNLGWSCVARNCWWDGRCLCFSIILLLFHLSLQSIRSYEFSSASCLQLVLCYHIVNSIIYPCNVLVEQSALFEEF